MKASEFAEKLKKLVDEYGDLELMICPHEQQQEQYCFNEGFLEPAFIDFEDNSKYYKEELAKGCKCLSCFENVFIGKFFKIS